MSETLVQSASLVGHVIEDLTYDSLRPTQFQAALSGLTQPPQYKPGGFFVFSDLAPGTYTLRIDSPRFQALEQSVTIPHPGLVFEVSGSNEVFVHVNNVNGTRISFDTTRLTQPIRAGAPVLGPAGYTATLTADLDVGRILEIRVENVTGTLAAGDLVRIIRDRSIRLPFHPAARLPVSATRLVGTVTRQSAPDIPLPGAQVQLTRVNDIDVVLQDIAGVQLGTVSFNGTTTVVGAERDLTTHTNQQGDYNLYYSAELSELGTGPGSPTQETEVEVPITVEVTLDGFQSQTIPILMRAGQRQRIDVALTEV